ncbi:LysR family transcriptional regulator [Stappia stellulata]|uniref:LysR family transcriptional regulator n=1 Tax=Stappia stellulata TaxID=71235 RepID=UPI000428C805|nr:LysR family transcriptional regulator [Stappia stellulata]
MSLSHLRSFIEVYRHRSFTAAARALGLTQPALSQHVASLEGQLGRPLFDRHARGVLPTAAADDLAARLGSSLDDAETALASAQARSAMLTGTIHLAGPADFLAEGCAPLLARLQKAGLTVRIDVGGREALYEKLFSDEVDLAITASAPVDARLDHARIAEERLLLVAAPGAMRVIDAARDLETGLQAIPCVAYDLDRPLVRSWLEQNGIALPDVSPAYTAPDLRLLRGLVSEGAGWTVLPDYLCTDALRAKRLVARAAPVSTPVNPLNLVWARSALRHPRIAFARKTLLQASA